MPLVELKNVSGQYTAINTDAVAYLTDYSTYVAVHFIGSKENITTVAGSYPQVLAKLRGSNGA